MADSIVENSEYHAGSSEEELLISSAQLRVMKGEGQTLIILGVIVSCASVLVWSRKLRWHDLWPILLICGVASFFFVRTVASHGHGPLTDLILDGKWLRGTDASKYDADEPVDIFS